MSASSILDSTEARYSIEFWLMVCLAIRLGWLIMALKFTLFRLVSLGLWKSTKISNDKHIGLNLQMKKYIIFIQLVKFGN